MTLRVRRYGQFRLPQVSGQSGTGRRAQYPIELKLGSMILDMSAPSLGIGFFDFSQGALAGRAPWNIETHSRSCAH